MTVGKTTSSRLLLFTGLYFSQGVQWGFFTVAIMLQLTTRGLGSAALGQIASMAWLPWMLKPLLGLLIDRFSFASLGRRRPYILAAEAGMACTLLAMAFVDPIHATPVFTALLFSHNLFAAIQDVGTDALAIDILPAEERGRANGFMSAGKFVGVVVGGQGLLWVSRLAGWKAAYLLAIALLLVPALLVLVTSEPAESRRPTHLFRDMARLFSFRIVLVAALFATIVDASDNLLFPLIFPLLSQKLHFTEQQIATLSTIGGAVSALASVGGGWLSDRFGRRRTLIAACSGVALSNLVFLSTQSYWGSYTFQLGFAAASAVATGVAYASTTALFMDLTHPRLAATHFQLSMALLNMRGVWGGRVGGKLAESLPAKTMFGLAALVEVLPLLLLAFLDPSRAKKDFERAQSSADPA